MGKDLTNEYIDETYKGILHLNGEEVSDTRSQVCDGVGNELSLYIGKEGEGIAVVGDTLTEDIYAGDISSESITTNDILCNSLSSSSIDTTTLKLNYNTIDPLGEVGNLLYKDGQNSIKTSPQKSLLQDTIIEVVNEMDLGLELETLNPPPGGSYRRIDTITVTDTGLVTNVITASALSPNPQGLYSNVKDIRVNSDGQVTSVVVKPELSPSPQGVYENVKNISVNSEGQVTNVVIGEAIAIDTQLIIDQIYPIGAVYFTMNSQNPKLILGGDWTRIAKGKFIVGVGSGSDSLSSTKTYVEGDNAGNYRVELTTANLPAHSHRVNPPPVSHSHDITIPSYTTSNGGAHSHKIYVPGAGTFSQKTYQHIESGTELLYHQNSGHTSTTALSSGVMNLTGEAQSTGSSHTHQIDIPTFTSGTTEIDIGGFNSNTTGGGSRFPVAPPAFGMYIWERIA